MRIRVNASGVNFADVIGRLGLYPDLPKIAGETVVIHSAGGGVGIAATQIAKLIRAKVIGTASAAKHGELRVRGVDHLVDYRTEDFQARARQITGGRGVELILDAVGGDSLKEGFRLLAPTGRLGAFGASRRPRIRLE